MPTSHRTENTVPIGRKSPRPIDSIGAKHKPAPAVIYTVPTAEPTDRDLPMAWFLGIVTGVCAAVVVRCLA